MTNDVRKALDDIHMAACYGTEENPEAARDALLTIGKIARKALAEIEATQPDAESRTESAAQPSAEPTYVVETSADTRAWHRASTHASAEAAGRAAQDLMPRLPGSQFVRISRVDAPQPSAEPTTECTTCGATVVRVAGVYDYPPPGDELVRAARTVVAEWREPNVLRAMDDAIDALRLALDADDGAGSRA